MPEAYPWPTLKGLPDLSVLPTEPGGFLDLILHDWYSTDIFQIRLKIIFRKKIKYTVNELSNRSSIALTA